ncbi:MAG: CocE/NonD family hydrolase [Kiritimatiellae bacterium]|nr:CocE/NonD family hydrolase [Kiritimatiellia bacterium]
MNAKPIMFAVAIGLSSAYAAEVRVSADGSTRFVEDFMKTADGAELYTLSVAPAGPDTFPIAVTRMAYARNARVDMEKWVAEQREFVSRGYSRVYQHCRGCGMSSGKRVPYESERADGLALLDYVRRLPWYGGEIYLSGSSYNATVHFAYLNTNPPDVKGAALFVQDTNRYNIKFRNGFFKAGLHGGWFVKEYMKKDKSLVRNTSETFAAFPLDGFARRYWGFDVPVFTCTLRHPRHDDPFWISPVPGSGVECRDAMQKSSMPILLKTALYDIYTEGICDMWRELPPERRAQCALLIDAYGHAGAPPEKPGSEFMVFPGGSRRDEGVDALDWFDSIRGGKPCPEAPRGRTRYYALWENAWHEADALENGPREVKFVFGKGERTYVYDPKRPLPEFPGSGGICFGGMQVQPPSGFRDDVLSYILPEITGRIDVRGRMEAELSVASDREDTCFYVRTSVDKGDGKWLLLRDDIKSLAFDSPYAPGERRTLRFRFADHAFRLDKGDRLRVDVSSACSQFAPHPNTAGNAFAETSPRVARNSVFAEGSSLTLHALP